MKILVFPLLLVSPSVHALVGLPQKSCDVLRAEASEMRQQAVTGVYAGDTEFAAGLSCGGHIPWEDGAAVLNQYWNRCADIYDQLYKANCDLP